MYPDLSAFGRPAFGALGSAPMVLPPGEMCAKQGLMWHEELQKCVPQPTGPYVLPPEGKSSEQIPPTAIGGGAPPPPPMQSGLDAPILAPDPFLMAEQHQQTRTRTVLKYVIIGLLGTASGAVVAHQMGKSKLAGAGIGGIGSVGILFIADLIKMGFEVSEGLAPITSA